MLPFMKCSRCWHSGGTLVLIPEELRRDAVALLRLMEDKAIWSYLLFPVVAQPIGGSGCESQWNTTQLFALNCYCGGGCR